MAKFCPNCGIGLADAAKFCPGCGTQIPGVPLQQAQYIQPQPPLAKKKSKGLFIALGVAVPVIAMIVLIAALGKDSDAPTPILPTTSQTAAVAESQSHAAPAAAATTKPTTTSKPTTTNPPSNNSKLVGHWQNTSYDVVGRSWDYWHLLLNADGTFNYFLVTTAEYTYKGDYSVSNGKIYFTNVVFTNDDYKGGKPDSWVDYELGFDSDGKEQLRITNTSGENWMGSPTWNRAD